MLSAETFLGAACVTMLATPGIPALPSSSKPEKKIIDYIIINYRKFISHTNYVKQWLGRKASLSLEDLKFNPWDWWDKSPLEKRKAAPVPPSSLASVSVQPAKRSVSLSIFGMGDG